MQIKGTTINLPAWSNLTRRCSEVSLIVAAFVMPLSITLTNVFIILAAVLSLACLDRQHYRLMWQHPVTKWALALFILVVLGVLWSTAPVAQRLGAIEKYSKFVCIILLFPVLRSRRSMIWALHAFLLAVSILVLISYLRWLGWVHSTQPADSVIHNHIIMSFFVAFATYLALHFACTQRPYRWLYLTLFVFLTFQMFFINQGRTGYLVYLGLLILLGCQYFRWKGVIAALFLCGLLVAGGVYFSPRVAQNLNVTVTSLANYSKDTPTAQETSWGFRLSFAKVSVHLMEQKPWLGFGTGSFPTEFAKTGGLPGWGDKLATPHNEYLLFGVQFGLFGLALFILFFLRLFILAFKFTAENARPAQALLVACTLSYFCDALFFISAVGYFFVGMIGVLFASLWLHHLDIPSSNIDNKSSHLQKKKG